MIRSIIQSVVEGAIKRFTGTGRSYETFTSREYFQHYGFTSRPQAGAEGIVIVRDNHIVMIASDDRRYRISLADGEVALYDDVGQKVHLTRDGLEVESPLKVTVTAPQVDVEGATVVNVVSPQINLGEATRAELRRLIDERFITVYNGHVHGASPTPTPQITVATCATEITRAE